VVVGETLVLITLSIKMGALMRCAGFVNYKNRVNAFPPEEDTFLKENIDIKLYKGGK